MYMAKIDMQSIFTKGIANAMIMAATTKPSLPYIADVRAKIHMC